MADEEHLAILEKGVEAWNAWREENPGIRTCLTYADLENADLENADLENADLKGAKLKGANLAGAKLAEARLWFVNLTGADLRRADLRRASLRSAKLIDAKFQNTQLTAADFGYTKLASANLQGAELWFVNLVGAKLAGANLTGAKLTGADLRGADLQGADLTAARISSAVLAKLDLREVSGLDKVSHIGASSISSDTLSISQGRIPAAFLRGCGLSDWEIANAKLHDPTLSTDEVIDITYKVAQIKAESPTQINPIFISYSRKDSKFVESLEKLLDSKRVRYWRDVHDLTSGKLETQIDRAIRHNPTVLIVLSEHSTESDWVRWEASKARELEKKYREDGKPRDVLCPISLDDSWKNSSWPGPLRQQIEDYNILPFSNWEDEAKMEEAFKKLFKGLGLYYREG